MQDFHERGQPVISVDGKKKELIGNFKNAGREWHPSGHPPDVRVYDFIDSELGKVTPYGVYDIVANEGWVSVGVTHDTPAFAVASIRMWWIEMGRVRHPHAKELLIVADSGGSNSARSRLWKVELQNLATAMGLRISVSHLPPGTSKWNKIEHRMFCHITHNWRGRPLESRAVVVNLIGSTTTDVESALTWKSGSRKEWERTNSWHLDVNDSTQISKREKSYAVTVDNNDELRRYYDHHLPFYERMHQHRLLA